MILARADFVSVHVSMIIGTLRDFIHEAREILGRAIVVRAITYRHRDSHTHIANTKASPANTNANAKIID